jgi:hypothetical protein
MRQMIIGLSGPARAGKDTVGALLSERLNGHVCYALAAPIKTTVNALYGWNEKHSDGELKEVIDDRLGFSPRQAYQKFGTEYGRALNADHWLRLADIKYNENDNNLIITDIRFDNEAQFIIDRGGVVIKIENPDTPQVATHQSEAGISPEYVGEVIYNNIKDGMGPLIEQVDALCTKLIGNK